MKKGSHYILLISVLLFGAGLYSLNADYLTYTSSLPELTVLDEPIMEGDTIAPRYPVAKTVPEEYNDIVKKSPMDLRNPDNVKTTIEYDIKTNTYVVTTKLGDMELSTPMSLTPEEYQDYSLQQSLRSYFRQKNEESYLEEMNKEFKITDMGFDLGPAEKIFGKGGVRVKTQGTAEIQMGLKSNKTDNPSLPQRSRNRTFFNFDEQVQLNVQANVGEKVNFGMNYNTETTFDYDSKKLKLAYEGTEDEIIKVLEAGNVSMNTSNSLIRGGSALFGIKTELQFGKLHVGAIFSQQESESQTVSSKGGVQTKPYEFAADQYDENRHFFLSHYFRDTYDDAMSKLPYINSAVSISRAEVWITNKRSSYDQARNIVAFSDLAENNHISNPQFTPSGSLDIPYNGANSLYQQVVSGYPDARNISTVSQSFSGFIEGGIDYEKVESARKLDASEYTLNKQLGYISLKTQLQPDEVLAVAYEYTYRGSVYQVGEFATDNSVNTNNNLYVKLLKGTAMSPSSSFWDLMMKNVYSLGAYSVQKEKFKLDILYQSDTTGVYLQYLSEGNIKDKLLLRVMNLDRLDSKNENYPDGVFDFLEGYTMLSENGRVFFPVVEPFGAHLRKMIGNDAIANKYVYQELYDSTLTVARQITEKNKFLIKGEYKASSSSEIQLGASNVARGSVRVTAAGVTLQENVDYSVDYTSGIVTILNENIISSGTAVSVSLENQSTYSMQRKTMMGVDLNYEFNKNFNLGATIMHMSEMPLTTKTSFGEESVKNTLWGLNTSFKTESQWLTNLFDRLPLLTLTKPSQITLKAEFANLIAGHYENKYTGGYSYLDDFESTQTGIDLLNPYPWTLSSVPYNDAANSLFPEASLINNVDYGKNRALLAWYYIDGLFTRKNSSIAPNHIKNDLEQLSNHYVREVKTQELFPNKDLAYNENNTLSVLNLAYYPTERGPYNLDADQVNSDGKLAMPEKRWGGIMRKIEQSDFEAANIEYIEFWMLDPFIYNTNGDGGDLYFNLGEISEDILKDEKKYFENGLPIDGDETAVEQTVWGKVPKRQSTVYAFDNTQGARKLQDVGLNGLSSEEEKTFPTYQDYLTKLQGRLSGETLA
ncbi:MAG: cell surface protein SprA, partial [Parabacteroides sp.]|nr:cell surface protein SprA [Parabacteroides sp.]